jgi:hypothetical protein
MLARSTAAATTHSDEQAAALTQELHNIVENDRYPFSPRIRTLRAILGKLRPEPVREPLPPPKATIVYMLLGWSSLDFNKG